jgi:hypothetical protein
VQCLRTSKGDVFTPDRPRLWSSTPIFFPGSSPHADLAPDGKRFIVFPLPETPGDQKSSVHITVLLNFFDEVRRKIPGGK